MNDGQLLTAGGIGTIVSALCFVVGVYTKYLIDKRKMSDDQDGKYLGQLSERILELEKENKLCMERNTELSKRIGYLEGRCELLEQKLESMNKS